MAEPVDDQDLHRKLDLVLEHLDRIHQGIAWFLDPPPQEHPEDEGSPGNDEPKAKKDRRYDYGDPVALKALRPKAWGIGRQLREDGRPKADNPYRDTRGGYRNAVFGGWEERNRELQEEPQDP